LDLSRERERKENSTPGEKKKEDEEVAGI